MEFESGLVEMEASRHNLCADVMSEYEEMNIDKKGQTSSWGCYGDHHHGDASVDICSLHAAVKMGNLELVQECIYSGMPVDVCDGNGVTPLLLACISSQPAIVQLLLDAGADPNIMTSECGTALHTACFNGCLPIVDSLVRGGANVDLQGPSNQTGLFLASLKGHIKVIKLLLSRRAKMDVKDKLGLTALHAAIIENHVEAALYLIQEGASVNKSDSRGNLPLHYAVKQHSTKLVTALVNAGCSVECCNGSFETPLLLAVRTGHLPTLSLLLKLGCNVNRRKPDGGSCAIHVLVSKYDASYPTPFKKVLELLMLAGCDINTQAFITLETPLYRALSYFKYEVAEILLAHGADPNLSSPFDITALHLAFLKQSPQIVLMMIHSGISWNRERWISKVPLSSQTPESRQMICDMCNTQKQPMSLVNLCRIVYRKHHGGHLYRKLSLRNDIPLLLKNFLLFADISRSSVLLNTGDCMGSRPRSSVQNTMLDSDFSDSLISCRKLHSDIDLN